MEIQKVAASFVSKPLCEIPSPPVHLWTLGTPAPNGTKYLAVVGSRALTPYGREACAKLISGLSGYPISIISGLALGADSCAHRTALTAGLHTIAIPGSGLSDNAISPRTNLGLAHDILNAGGLLISEHPPEYLPHPYDFPSRNRIMVGMADAVLVIEAGEKSGTLITARLASEYGRDLLCVPHRIGDIHSYGAELFLRLGAGLVAKSEHILEALGISTNGTSARNDPSLEGLEKTLFEMLKTPCEKNMLAHASGRSISEVLTTLVTLELKGLAKEEFGLWRRI